MILLEHRVSRAKGVEKAPFGFSGAFVFLNLAMDRLAGDVDYRI